MKKYFIYIILLILLFTALISAQSAREVSYLNSNTYFPVNDNVTLVYKTSFGEGSTKYIQNGEYTISSSEGDRFKYRQTLLIKEDGVYVKEVYQYMKIFLFIKKEATYTYGKPLLRFPLPLSPGIEWKWEGDEYKDGDTNKVTVTGKTLGMESIDTKAGRFESVKIETVVEGSGNTKNRITEWYAAGIGLIKAKIIIDGGGIMGFLRDLLGYGTIEFELQEIKRQ